jgi:hypothetical protein
MRPVTFPTRQIHIHLCNDWTMNRICCSPTATFWRVSHLWSAFPCRCLSSYIQTEWLFNPPHREIHPYGILNCSYFSTDSSMRRYYEEKSVNAVRNISLFIVTIKIRVRWLLCLIKHRNMNTFSRVEAQIYAVLTSALDGYERSDSA